MMLQYYSRNHQKDLRVETPQHEAKLMILHLSHDSSCNQIQTQYQPFCSDGGSLIPLKIDKSTPQTSQNRVCCFLHKIHESDKCGAGGKQRKVPIPKKKKKHMHGFCPHTKSFKLYHPGQCLLKRFISYIVILSSILLFRRWGTLSFPRFPIVMFQSWELSGRVQTHDHTAEIV